MRLDEAVQTAVAAQRLQALGHPARLEIFRLLVRAGPAGAVVGEIQSRLRIPASTLSHHIASLVRVGLVSQRRRSRQLVCRAEFTRMHRLLDYLVENCCAGIEAPEPTERRRR